MRRVLATGERCVEVVGRGRGQRVDGGRVAAHRRGEDPGDHEPGEARGQLCDHERRIDRVAPHAALVRPREPQGSPDEQEQRELRDDEHARSDQRALCIPQAVRGEEPLDDQVIGPVRGGCQQPSADHAAPERVQDGERRSKVERGELARVPGARERPDAPRQMGGDHERRNAAQQVHAELDHVHPHHRPQAADPGVHERDHPDGQDSQGEIPMSDDRQWDGGREDPHAVGQRPREEEDP